MIWGRSLTVGERKRSTDLEELRDRLVDPHVARGLVLHHPQLQVVLGLLLDLDVCGLERPASGRELGIKHGRCGRADGRYDYEAGESPGDDRTEEAERVGADGGVVRDLVVVAVGSPLAVKVGDGDAVS